LDPEELRQGRAHLPDQLAHLRDDRRHADLDRLHLQDLDDQRVAGLGASHGNRSGGAVHPFEVDAGDEIALALDLAGEAVVRLQRDDGAGLDLEHGLHVGADPPDALVACHTNRHQSTVLRNASTASRKPSDSSTCGMWLDSSKIRHWAPGMREWICSTM